MRHTIIIHTSIFQLLTLYFALMYYSTEGRQGNNSEVSIYIQCSPAPDLLGLLGTEGALVGLEDTGGGACFVLDALASGGVLNDGRL